jgi:hypothetical protein
LRKLTAAGSAAFIGKRILPVESLRRLLQSAWDAWGKFCRGWVLKAPEGVPDGCVAGPDAVY